MWTVGPQEMIVIFLVALVLFGPKKLPELGKTIGKALTEFRRASSDLKATFEREMHNLERETESLKQVADSTANTIHQSVSAYDPFADQEGAYRPLTETPAVAEIPAPQPSTVSASEVPGAESHGSATTTTVAEHEAVQPEPAPHEPAQPALAHVEGTVPRSENGTHNS
jgi:TatA/E family protein of Tat protein translocase